MMNKNFWLNFPPHLERPSTRSLSLIFILEELVRRCEQIQKFKDAVKESPERLNEEFSIFFSLNNSFPQTGLFPDKLCFYCDILIQASKIKDHSLLKELDEMRISILQFRSQLYRNSLKNREFGKEASQNFDSERATIAERPGAGENYNFERKPTPLQTDSSSCFGIYPQNDLSLDPSQLSSIFDFLLQKLRVFFSALIPFLHEAKTDENILLALIEQRQILNRHLGTHTIEKILQKFFPNGHAHLRAIISEGLIRRGFSSFLAEKEHLIEEIEWESPCLTTQD